MYARFSLPVVIQALFLLARLGSGGNVFADTSALVDQGQRAFDKGAFSQAATDWQQALESFRRERNVSGEVRTALSLAGAYQALGQQQHAVQVLNTALERAKNAGDGSLLTLAKAKLGAALILTLDYERAEPLLGEAREEARQKENRKLAASILNDQGNLLAAKQKHAEALEAFSESARLSQEDGDTVLAAKALCNSAGVAVRLKENKKADDLTSQTLAALSRLDDSHTKAFLLVTAAQTDREIKLPEPGAQSRLMRRAHDSLEQALKISIQLEDHALESYALAGLGQLYEQDGQLDGALGLTHRAVFAAQQAQIPDAMVRWEWQLGRLLKKHGEKTPAIEAYRRAVQTLQPIRNDIALGYGNSRAHLPFREAQGPLFFELADLLLSQVDSSPSPGRTQDLLVEARDTVEQLKAVELEDYFRDDCVNVQRSKTRALETVDQHTAIVYLIPLPERTELLIGLMSGLRRFKLDVTEEMLAGQVRQLRRNLETRTTYGYLAQAQQLYDWLIRPIRGLLSENQINTLVFVPDGALRTIPLASLHDGEHFLVENFAIAVAPGLSLVEPQPLKRESARLLLNGLSEPVQGFPALSFVPGELRSIQPMYANDTLLDERFTLKELEHQLTSEQYSIVHIASHGQFDRDVRKTFILTHDSKLTLNRLEGLIRPSQYRGRPVELLVLSACQTAAGDDRAALGLAGVAVKAGARSALATLWFVNDQSTSVLISELYDQLRQTPAVSKARALQIAQIKLLHDRRYRHPCYWSPYLIIGNWL